MTLYLSPSSPRRWRRMHLASLGRLLMTGWISNWSHTDEVWFEVER